jgi:hypothetical protein
MRPRITPVRWWNNRRWRLQMKAANERNDAFVLSVPKCGRTWHMTMLGAYLTQLVGDDPRSALSIGDLTQKAGFKRLSYSHNRSQPNTRISPMDEIVAAPIQWRDRDVMLLVRDPRDTLVSAYFHVVHREGRFSGTLSEFIRTPALGIEKLLVAYNRWYGQRALTRSFQVTSYERMHSDPSAVLRQTLSFIGADRINTSLLSEAVKFSSIDRMREYERENYFDSYRLRNSQGRSESAKVRTGKIGGYRSHLSAGDLGFIEAAIARHGNPFADYCAIADRKSAA